ncbi:MAG TPA: hypothetical protein VIO14_13310, partial [Dehalococcoidia bacterium]
MDGAGGADGGQAVGQGLGQGRDAPGEAGGDQEDGHGLQGGGRRTRGVARGELVGGGAQRPEGGGVCEATGEAGEVVR